MFHKDGASPGFMAEPGFPGVCWHHVLLVVDEIRYYLMMTFAKRHNIRVGFCVSCESHQLSDFEFRCV